MKKHLLVLLATIIPTITINQLIKTENVSFIKNNNDVNKYSLNLDSSNQYQSSFNTMFNNLVNNSDLLISIPQDTNNNKELFKVANRNNSNKYLILEETYNQKSIDLIIETSYWYLDGFVPLTSDTSQLTYYHFTKGKILSLPWVKNNIDLHYNGDYYSLAGKTKDVNISKSEIISDFNKLYDAKLSQDFKLLKLSLVTTVFETSEALRFFTVRNSVSKVLSDSSSFSWRNTYLHDTLQQWGAISRKYYSGDVDEAKAKISTLNLPRKKQLT